MFEAPGGGYIEGYELPPLAVVDYSVPILQELEQIPVPEFQFQEEFNLPVIVSADNLPSLRQSRQAARTEGRDVIEFNRLLQDAGYEDHVPLVVDPLGTAKLVIEAEVQFGVGSPEYAASLEALYLDTRRMVGEVKRKLTWEDFPEAVQEYDHHNQDFLSNGVSLQGLNYNGLTPNAEAENEEVRVEDWVEEKGTYQPIGKLVLGDEVDLDLLPADRRDGLEPSQIRTTRFSLCPDWAIRKFRLNPDSGESYEGLVPQIEKFVIRSMKFDADQQNRRGSQLAVPGTYIDAGIIAQGINLLDRTLPVDASKQEINRTMMVTEEEIDEWDWIELFDALASAKHSVEIFMGEVFHGEVKDYAAAKAQSEKRYLELESDTDTLTSEILMLAKSGIDPVAAGGIIESRLKSLMLEECKSTPAKAREMFNEETAVGFEKAKDLELMGRFMDATNLRQVVAEQAPEVSFCGAGSCGLDNVSKFEIESDDKLTDLIEDGDIVLKDTERKCTCGMKTIVYVFNESKVTKYCSSCKREETTRGKKQ